MWPMPMLLPSRKLLSRCVNQISLRWRLLHSDVAVEDDDEKSVFPVHTIKTATITIVSISYEKSAAISARSAE